MQDAKEYIDKLIEMFKTAERQGMSLDIPEGVKYITISETLVNQITENLESLFK